MEMNTKDIKQIRLSLGYTQSKMASVLKVHTRTVQRWESGDRTCPESIILLAWLLKKGL